MADIKTLRNALPFARSRKTRETKFGPVKGSKPQGTINRIKK